LREAFGAGVGVGSGVGVEVGVGGDAIMLTGEGVASGLATAASPGWVAVAPAPHAATLRVRIATAVASLPNIPLCPPIPDAPVSTCDDGSVLLISG
jgi:hypothetical protein